MTRASMSLRCSIAMQVVTALLAVPLDAQRRDTLHVALLSASRGSDAVHATSIARGVELGTAEAARTAALFGVTLAVTAIDPSSPVQAATELVARGASAIVISGLPALCGQLEPIAARRQTVVLTLDCPAPARDDAGCDRTVFHLAPSAASRARARDLLAHDRGTSIERHGHVVVWHHTLDRFGAEQLNERFTRRFDAPMDSSAWTAWLAVKILGEAALRARTTTGRELAHHLLRPTTRFDGHKGEPLTFDPRTGELRQPLYLLAGTGTEERMAGEVRGTSIHPRTGRGEPACPADGGSRAR